MKTRSGGRLQSASPGTVYAVVRQGTDDELSSSPADRDARASRHPAGGQNAVVEPGVAQIRFPVSVNTSRPVAWRGPPLGLRKHEICVNG